MSTNDCMRASSVSFSNVGTLKAQMSTAPKTESVSNIKVFNTEKSAEAGSVEGSEQPLENYKNDAVKILKVKIKDIIETPIIGVKIYDIPKVINNLLLGVEGCKAELDGLKELIGEDEFNQLKGQLISAQDMTCHRVMGLIENLEESPEMLASVRKDILEKAEQCDSKNNKMNIYAKLKEVIDEKYPEDKVNELKKKKSIAEQIDSITGHGVFTTSIKNTSTKDLHAELDKARGESLTSNTTPLETEKYTKNNHLKKGFGNLTTQSKTSNGKLLMLG